VRFERPNVYALSLTAPLDRVRFKGAVPRGLRELRRPREAVEMWDVLELSFYPDGIADVRLVRRERTKDGFEKTERHWIETVTAEQLSRGLHPERAVAPLILSLAGDELVGPAAHLAVWAVFERLVLRAGNRRLRSLLSEEHWLVLEMAAARSAAGEQTAVGPRRRVRVANGSRARRSTQRWRRSRRRRTPLASSRAAQRAS
jgi:hypothetical protein